MLLLRNGRSWIAWKVELEAPTLLELPAIHKRALFRKEFHRNDRLCKLSRKQEAQLSVLISSYLRDGNSRTRARILRFLFINILCKLSNFSNIKLELVLNKGFCDIEILKKEMILLEICFRAS